MTQAISTAADRIWEENFLAGHGDFSVISTDWEGANRTSQPGSRSTPAPEPPATPGEIFNPVLNKPINATNSHGDYGPAQGNDSDPGTTWSEGATPACWEVDLQNLHAVRTVEVSSNQFGDAGDQTVFQVRASQDNPQR